LKLAEFRNRQLRDQKWCGCCGETIADFDRFCPGCGTPNPLFDIGVFQAMFEVETVEESIARDCRGETAHRGLLEPYCPVCGSKLDPEAQQRFREEMAAEGVDEDDSPPDLVQ
jgi:predicted amidophosphoribosyltransferase